MRTASWFRMYRWPESVLDVDDLQSRTHRSVAHAGGSLGKRLVNLRRAWIWRRRERTLTDRFDVLTVCSEEDRRYLGMEERTHVIPNGSNPMVVRPRVSADTPRIGFIGNCEFMPNEEGLKWFIREAWPLIQRQSPRVHLRIVGRKSESYSTTLDPDHRGAELVGRPRRRNCDVVRHDCSHQGGRRHTGKSCRSIRPEMSGGRHHDWRFRI